MREYQAEHLKNGQRLDELKKRAGQLRKGKSLSERQMAASINEALERIGREYPAESLEIDPSVSDVPEYPVAVARLKAEKERQEAEVRDEAERRAAERAAEERAKREAEAAAEAVRRAAEQARREAEKEAEARRRAALEEKRREEIRRKEEQMKKERIRGLYDKMVSEADRLADTVFGLPFDQPYKWEYINYIDERRFMPMAELTEESMQKPFLTYEQFMAEKERLKESVADDVMQGEDIPDFSVSTVPNAVSDPEVPGISVQKETVSRTQDFLQNTESSLESPAEKTVAKQDYMRMTDKEKAEWIGISLSDMPGSIKHFKSKMEQLGIWQKSTIEMTDEFMKLWNQVEKERDALQNRKDYQQVRIGSDINPYHIPASFIAISALNTFPS